MVKTKILTGNVPNRPITYPRLMNYIGNGSRDESIVVCFTSETKGIALVREPKSGGVTFKEEGWICCTDKKVWEDFNGTIQVGSK